MSYTLTQAIADTRRHLKDITENVWLNDDVIAFINEAIMLIKGTVPLYFDTLVEVTALAPDIMIDDVYKNLIPLFASARCFEQDEQNYRAVQKMNEFESRKTDMLDEIYNSDTYQKKLQDAINAGTFETETVLDVYFDVLDEDKTLPLDP